MQQTGDRPGDATLHATDNRTGGNVGTQNASIQIQSIAAPDTITASENLTVDYTLENVGDTDGTESFVDLLVNGTDSAFDDTDGNVTVPAGGTTSGTLTFDNVSGFFSAGDTINFSVQLWDFGDVASGTTDVVAANPDIQIKSITSPDNITASENLTVDYTLENVGDANGTESFVDLLVNGTNSSFDDSDQNVAVPAGGTTSGTLTFDNVSEFFSAGDTINFSVELWDFVDVASGTTDVTGTQNPPEYVVTIDGTPVPAEAGDDLVVDATVTNSGGEAGKQDVTLSVDGDQADSATGVELDPGETWNGSLVYGTEEADVPSVSVTVGTENDTASDDAQVYGPVPDYEVGDVDHDGEVDIVDVVRIQRHLAQLDPDPFDPELADVERTGKITIVDAVRIQRELALIDDPGVTNVTTVSAPAEVTVGDDLDVSATIANDGDLGTIQTAEFRLAADQADLDENATISVDVVDLGGGGTVGPTATIDTDRLVPGKTYHLAVVTRDDSTTVTVDVVAP